MYLLIKNYAVVASLVTVLFFTGCARHIIQVDYPKPTDNTAKVSGYTTDAAGHFSIKIIFNYPMDASTIVVTRTLKLHFSKDANTNATVSWSADKKTATVTTIMTRDQLTSFHPDDYFSLTLIGVDEGNGLVKSEAGEVLDGDYNISPGGNYVMSFTMIG